MGDFETEIESITGAAAWMETNAIATAKKLQETLNYLNLYAASSDWSGVPSCTNFGATYNAAIASYKALADDLVADAETMRGALQQIAHNYATADASSADRLNAAIAGLADQHWFSTDDGAQSTYQHNRPDLHSDDATQAPHADADTGSSGSPSGAGGQGGSPQSTPATQGTPATSTRVGMN